MFFGWSISSDSCGNKSFRGRNSGVVSSMREMGIISMDGYGTVVLVIMCKMRYLNWRSFSSSGFCDHFSRRLGGVGWSRRLECNMLGQGH